MLNRRVWVLVRIVARPIGDWLDALHACVGEGHRARIAVIMSVLLLSWWVYVPVHELAHAWGCLLAFATYWAGVLVANMLMGRGVSRLSAKFEQ